MGDARRLYLKQKRGATLIEMDAGSYNRLLDSPASVVIGYRNNKPVVKMS